jgi:SAM-dependent methyltransferase
MNSIACRFCGSPVDRVFLDLGATPLSNSYLGPSDLLKMEPFFPLTVYLCENCFLVQIPEIQGPEEIFTDYAYFSSYSDMWLRHAEDYVEAVVDRFRFNEKSSVVEIASNDGYLLQYFMKKGIPVLGIEPAENVARIARAKGIRTLTRFFGTTLATELALEHNHADLLIGNNVLAHVPDINDFVGGLKVLLRRGGILTLEFPHLMRLMQENQFDTIYHEHFSYFSFLTADRIFEHHGLTIFDVDELDTHGGSLRIYVRHTEDRTPEISPRVSNLLRRERSAGILSSDSYTSFAERVKDTKRGILAFLIEAKREGKKIAAYGAPAKGNTLLNYCGIGTDFIDYTVDRNPYKQGKYLPGTRIPILPPEKISEAKPDFVVILPWNLKEEILAQMSHIRRWGGRFVVFIPEVGVF